MAASSKKRRPMEAEPGEGKAHEMKESPAEELREGSENEEGEHSTKTTSRKRSAKGAKSTKAPMDAEGCACGGKKGSSCDGNCGDYAKKDRNDALTPQEYLAACDLGIQNRSRTYIRARLDTAERLDLKCGNGSISEGEKCSKGATAKATAIHNNGRPLSNKQVRQIEKSIVAREAATGQRVNISKEQAALLIATPGTQSRKFVAASLRTAKSKQLKGGISAAKASDDPMDKALSRVAKRELFNRRVRTGSRLLGAGLALGAVAASSIQTRRRDSVYASGFSLDQADLAI